MTAAVDYKKIASVVFLILVVLGQTLFSYTFLQPQPAQAQFATFSTTVEDFPRDIEQVFLAAAERIAISYANEYLQRFISELQDKYKIQNYLYYGQTLGDYYLTTYIMEKVQDPNLRQIYTLLNNNFITGLPTGTTGGLDPQSALIPQLQEAMNTYYQQNGGVNWAALVTPTPGQYTSDAQFYQSFMAYSSSPQDFSNSDIGSGFGAIAGASNSAATVENLNGNGNKSSRQCLPGDPGCTTSSGAPADDNNGVCSESNIDQSNLSAAQQAIINQDQDGTETGCDDLGGTWIPTAGSSSSSSSGSSSSSNPTQTTQEIVSAIQNPGAFVSSFADQAIGDLFGNAATNGGIYGDIGNLLGNFIFEKLQLNTSGSSGILPDVPTNYTPDNGADVTYPTVDLDSDGIPDGQAVDGVNAPADVTGANALTGKDDICFFGGVASEPYSNDPLGPTGSGCFESSTSGSSQYFAPLCESLQSTITALNKLNAFSQANGLSSTPLIPTPPTAQWWGGTGNRGEKLLNQANATVWLNKTEPVQNDMDNLFQTINGYDISGTGFDQDLFQIGQMDNYMQQVVASLNKDGDLNLDGQWDDYGGITNLILLTGQYATGLQQIANVLGKCDQPNFTAAAGVTLPPINVAGPNTPPPSSGTDVCTPDPTGTGDDAGAPTTIDPSTVSFVNTDGATTVGSWAQQNILNSVTIDENNTTFDFNPPPQSWFQDLVGGTTNPDFGIVSIWIMVWRGNQWLAYPYGNLYLGTGQTNFTGTGGIFCIGGPLSDFVPQAGDIYGFMMSTEARNNGFANDPTNPQQRSNIVTATWPAGITPPTQ